MTIKEAQELVDAWGDKHAIRHNELANMALLTEEIGKLARVMVRRYGEHALDFTGAHEAEDLGAWEQASLFSPMFAFADQPAAVATAREVMRLLRQSWSETSDRERTR